MRICIAAPLFPPEIGGAALYVKELGRRLAAVYTVTIVAYGHLPEKASGVRIIPIEKRTPLPLRLFVFTLSLWRAAKDSDVLYVENGASTELPAAIVQVFTGKKIILHLGDSSAHRDARQNPLRRGIERFVRARAVAVVENSPHMRPEVLPFGPRPENEMAAYEISWREHLAKLDALFDHEH